jgi:hypothetical protein
MDEQRCGLNHFLAQCSMSDRPGLDVRAAFWPETLLIIDTEGTGVPE